MWDLNKIIGKTIVKVEQIHEDKVLITFTDNSTISFESWSYDGGYLESEYKEI